MFSANTSQVSSEANWIESCFSSYLYTGNSTSGGTQTITNNVDLSTYGGMVWIKGRSAASDHILTDTTRGAGSSATNNQALASNLTSAEDLGGSSYDYLSSFSTTGFVVTQGGTSTATRGANYNNVTYASWTFRKQAKFFDVVTYTGNGANRTISHNLGSVPGCIIVKRTDTTGAWAVYHRSLANTEYMVLNTTAAKATGATYWNSTTPTSTVFSLGTATDVNASGGTYVAYLFAHDAGGFGTSGTDNVISCGSYNAGAGADITVDLGYEPQWALVKRTDTTGNWFVYDTMRGFGSVNPTTGGFGAWLYANLTDAETTSTGSSRGIYARGLDFTGQSGQYIYIAIRRGPMKTPTSGTSVYEAVTRTGTGANATVTTGFPVDLFIVQPRTNIAGTAPSWINRLAGGALYLRSSASFAEAGLGVNAFGTVMNGVSLGGDAETNYSPSTFVNWFFKRAPSFMDVVCYTGTDNDMALSHNLKVAPEAIILKKRNSTGDWAYETNFTSTQHTYFTLNSTTAGATTNYSSGINLYAQPTASTFYVAGGAYSTSGSTYVAYLFASCPGVSKVGSYTGTGTTLQIDCGFTGGARLVLIKRTDSTGAWYIWDSARGIVASTDPYLTLNTTAAEVTTTDWVDTYSAGFELSSNAGNNVNINGASYIFLSVA